MNREKFKAICAKAIVAAVITSGILALGAQTASAQAITASVPFAFSAGDQLFPAGTYQFTFLSEWSLSIQNVKGGGEKFFTVQPHKMNRTHPTPASSSTIPGGKRILKQSICPLQTGVWSCSHMRTCQLRFSRPYKARRSGDILQKEIERQGPFSCRSMATDAMDKTVRFSYLVPNLFLRYDSTEAASFVERTRL